MVLIKFHYIQEIDNYECNSDNNLLLICKIYILNKKLEPKIVYFSYNGKTLNLRNKNYSKTIGEEMNKASLIVNEMEILVNTVENDMRISNTSSNSQENQENNTIPLNILSDNLNNENQENQETIEIQENQETIENEEQNENNRKNEKNKNNEKYEDSEKILVFIYSLI